MEGNVRKGMGRGMCGGECEREGEERVVWRKG